MSFKSYLWLIPFICFITGYSLMSFLFKPKTLKTPYIIGKTINEALGIASKSDLYLTISTEKDDAELPDGTIISQTPSADTIIKARQSIYLVVSKKPALTPTPHFLQKPLTSIQEEVQTKNITLKIYELSSDTTPNNYCIAQWPASGLPYTEKNMIIYTANNHLKPVIMPNFKGKSVSEVLEFLQLHGLQATLMHIRTLEIGHTCAYCTVLDQRPLAGSIVSWNKEKPLQIQLQVG